MQRKMKHWNTCRQRISSCLRPSCHCADNLRSVVGASCDRFDYRMDPFGIILAPLGVNCSTFGYNLGVLGTRLGILGKPFGGSWVPLTSGPPRGQTYEKDSGSLATLENLFWNRFGTLWGTLASPAIFCDVSVKCFCEGSFVIDV